MAASLETLAELVRSRREARGLSQPALAQSIGTNRSAIAHLEQGRRLPPRKVLESLCSSLDIASSDWASLLEPELENIAQFEECVSELCGRTVTLRPHDDHATSVARAQIRQILDAEPRPSDSKNICDSFNSILVFYGVKPMSIDFFRRFIGPDGATSIERLASKIQQYQALAMRLFSTFSEAYDQLNSPGALESLLSPLESRSNSEYRDRLPAAEIEDIPEDKLKFLGYVAAKQVQQERAEREELATFMRDLASKLEKDRQALQLVPERKRRRMDVLLRKFSIRNEHGFLSSLFSPDSEQLRRDADAIAPLINNDSAQMALAQDMAQRNLARYLASDHLDVYVATSMRTHADFVSVNRFATSVFSHPLIEPLNLRYFNPTQSWIEDRVAKGMVEALMLRRSALTIFMAQKTDSFGKDSEASVSLGQGKPVIVYVPKLHVRDMDLDSGELGSLDVEGLRARVSQLLPAEELDEIVDREALLERLLKFKMEQLTDLHIATLVRSHWADFDLYEEWPRIEENERQEYRQWLDLVIKSNSNEVPARIRSQIITLLVEIAVRFEKRALLFRSQHPLALQVILSTGVLNGILVVRSSDACAVLIDALIRNNLSLELEITEQNYLLIERSTQSVVRVISKHVLITNAFEAFYASDRIERSSR